jgi:hypothetical protein
MANKTILDCQIQGLHQKKTEPISLCGNYRTETTQKLHGIKIQIGCKIKFDRGLHRDIFLQ